MINLKAIIPFLALLHSTVAHAGVDIPVFLKKVQQNAGHKYCTSGYIKNLYFDGAQFENKYTPSIIVEVDQSNFTGTSPGSTYFMWFAMDANKNQVQRWDAIMHPLVQAFEKRIPVSLGYVVSSNESWNYDCNSATTLPIYAPVALIRLCSNSYDCGETSIIPINKEQ